MSDLVRGTILVVTHDPWPGTIKNFVYDSRHDLYVIRYSDVPRKRPYYKFYLEGGAVVKADALLNEDEIVKFLSYYFNLDTDTVRQGLLPPMTGREETYVKKQKQNTEQT